MATRPRLLRFHWAVGGLQAEGGGGAASHGFAAAERSLARRLLSGWRRGGLSFLVLEAEYYYLSNASAGTGERRGGLSPQHRIASVTHFAHFVFSSARLPLNPPACSRHGETAGAHGGMSRCCAQGELKLWCQHA